MRFFRTVFSLTLIFSFLSVSLSASADQTTVTGTVRFGIDTAEGAVVYLKNSSQPPSQAPPEVAIRQKNQKFIPSFIAVPVGAIILFENDDSEMHNVRSSSPGNRFDVGAHPEGTTKKVELKTPGVVLLRCKIHEEMRGMIFVSPSPYFSVTGKNGTFKLPSVKPGSYRIEAWHPRLTAEEVETGGRTITVGNDPVPVDLTLNPKAPPESNLTELRDQDWTKVLDEIQISLTRAITDWKEGKKTVALTGIMTTYSRLYGQSGLRNAIVQKLGKAEGAGNEKRFNAMIKQVQGEGPEGETALNKEKEALLSDLKKTVQRLH
jgi:plastocyanin